MRNFRPLRKEESRNPKELHIIQCTLALATINVRMLQTNSLRKSNWSSNFFVPSTNFPCLQNIKARSQSLLANRARCHGGNRCRPPFLLGKSLCCTLFCWDITRVLWIFENNESSVWGLCLGTALNFCGGCCIQQRLKMSRNQYDQ